MLWIEPVAPPELDGERIWHKLRQEPQKLLVLFGVAPRRRKLKCDRAQLPGLGQRRNGFDECGGDIGVRLRRFPFRFFRGGGQLARRFYIEDESGWGALHPSLHHLARRHPVIGRVDLNDRKLRRIERQLFCRFRPRETTRRDPAKLPHNSQLVIGRPTRSFVPPTTSRPPHRRSLRDRRYP